MTSPFPLQGALVLEKIRKEIDARVPPHELMATVDDGQYNALLI